MVNNTSPRNPGGKPPGKRRRYDDSLDAKLVEMAAAVLQPNKSTSGEEAWCKSVVDTMQRLQPRKRAEVKVKIQQLLLEAEFGTE